MKESHRKLLECLADADEVLRRFHAGNGIEIMSEIDANGADRSGIAQANANVVGIERSEVVKADGGKYIAAVIEGNDAKTFLDRQRDARFGVDDELLIATAGNVDLRAIGSGFA